MSADERTTFSIPSSLISPRLGATPAPTSAPSNPTPPLTFTHNPFSPLLPPQLPSTSLTPTAHSNTAPVVLPSQTHSAPQRLLSSPFHSSTPTQSGHPPLDPLLLDSPSLLTPSHSLAQARSATQGAGSGSQAKEKTLACQTVNPVAENLRQLVSNDALWDKLLPHQKEGVEFLLSSVCSSLLFLPQGSFTAPTKQGKQKRSGGAVPFLVMRSPATEQTHKSRPAELSVAKGGCILADDMGLGKTLQVSVFLSVVLKHTIPAPHSDATNNNTTALAGHSVVICPAGTLMHWQNELLRWLPETENGKEQSAENCHTTYVKYGALPVVMFDVETLTTPAQRIQALEEYKKTTPCVLLVGFEAFRDITAHSHGDCSNSTTTQEAATDELKQLSQLMCTVVLNPGPHVLLIDEAHRLRNPRSKLSLALRPSCSPCRVLLTGYPLQNHLMEFWNMLQVALGAETANLIGSFSLFKEVFFKPLHSALLVDANPTCLNLARLRAMALTEKIRPFIKRRPKHLLATHLKIPMYRTCLTVRLTEMQLRIYSVLLSFMQNEFHGVSVRVLCMLCHVTRLLYNHPMILLAYLERCCRAHKASSSTSTTTTHLPLDADLENGNNDDDTDADNLNTDNSMHASSTDDIAQPELKDGVSGQSSAVSETHDCKIKQAADTGASSAVCAALTQDVATKLLADVRAVMHDYEARLPKHSAEENLIQPIHSGKMTLICGVLKRCARLREHCVLFSHSLDTLHFIKEHILPRVSGEIQRWDKQGGTHDFFGGVDIFELRGEFSLAEKYRTITAFNDPENPNKRLRVILVSSLCGSEGVSLHAASRVVLVDLSWNPSHEEQAASRVYRFGQTAPAVHVYRLVTDGTLETKMFFRHVQKGVLFRRIVDHAPCAPPYSKKEVSVSFGSLGEYVVSCYADGQKAATRVADRAKNGFAHDVLLQDLARVFDANNSHITQPNAVLLEIQQEEDFYSRDLTEVQFGASTQNITRALEETDREMKRMHDTHHQIAALSRPQPASAIPQFVELLDEDDVQCTPPPPSPPATEPTAVTASVAASRTAPKYGERATAREISRALLCAFEQKTKLTLEEATEVARFHATGNVPTQTVQGALNHLCQQGTVNRVSATEWVLCGDAGSKKRKHDGDEGSSGGNSPKKAHTADEQCPGDGAPTVASGENQKPNSEEGAAKQSAPRDSSNTPLMRLHELAKRLGQRIVFDVVGEEGPDHNRHFIMSLSFGGVRFDASSHSKKEGKQTLAALALARFQQRQTHQTTASTTE